MKSKHVELIIVFIAMLVPQFLLAGKIDGDEYTKATSGITLAGVILGGYKVWKTQQEKANDQNS